MSQLEPLDNGVPGGELLDREMLQRFAKRAGEYDRSGEFCAEDIAELGESGYLRAPVPTELGGSGLLLPQIARQQRTLAYHAASTAVAINMHLYWVGAAADRYRAGDTSLRWLLEAAARGEVVAAGHGEPGNDLVLDDSLTTATPEAGGYRFTGHKVFTSLSPAWTWLGLHGKDTSDPDNPKVVHAFVRRDDPGVTVKPTWDTIGLRATSSDDTLLSDAYAPAERVVEIVPLGQPPGPVISGIFAWVLPLLGNVYVGIARRALDLAIESAQRKTSLATGEPHAQHPVTQWHVAEAELKLEAAWGLLEKVAGDVADGVDYGERTLSKLFAAKYTGVEAAREVVDIALRIAGASSLHRKYELERLYRDVLPGGFHPPDSELVHSIIGQTALGTI